MHSHRPSTTILRALLLLSAVFALFVPHEAQAQDVRTPVRVLDHVGFVYNVAWSPDGAYVLTVASVTTNCTEDCTHTLYLWDMDQGNNPVILPLEPLMPYRYVAWNASGSHFLSRAEMANTVEVWSVGGGDPLVLHHEARIQGARWSPDGTRVLTWDWDGTVFAWPMPESVDPVVIRSPRQGDDDWRLPILDVQWSADGAHVFGYVYGDDYIGETVYVWAADGSGLVTTFEHDAWINGMIPSSYYGDALFTWSADGTARLWSLDGSANPVIFEHEAQVYHAAWNGSVNRIMTVDEYGYIATWTWDNTGVNRTRLNHPDQAFGVVANPVYEVAFATWAGGAEDDRYEVRVWGMTRLHYEEPIVLRHPAAVNGVAWSPASNALLTWADDHVARVYYRLTEEYVDFFALPHETPLDGAAWSPDGSQVVTWGGSQALIWSPFED